jgi:hypothetical protein
LCLAAGLIQTPRSAEAQQGKIIVRDDSIESKAGDSPQAAARPQIRSAEVKIDFTKTGHEGDGRFDGNEGLLQREDGLVIAEYGTSGSVTSERIRVPLVSAEPFLAVHPSWTTDEARPNDIKISVRASDDGRAWGEWKEVVPDHDSIADGGEHAGSSLYFDKRTEFLQYRLSLRRDGFGASPVVTGLRLTFVSPGATPKNTTQTSTPQEQVKGDTQLLAATYSAIPKPSMVSRTGWGCPDGQSSPMWAPQSTYVKHLIVHHTKEATDSTNSDWPAVVRDIWSKHHSKWGDIGYNYLVDPNGVIYEGRAGGEDVIGAHFSNANTGTMGVAMLGDYRDTSPSAAALASLKRLLAWKAAQKGIDPEGSAYHVSSGLTLNNISGHRDANSSPYPEVNQPGTVCPGDGLYKLLPTIRHDVRNILSGVCGGLSVPADHWKGSYFNNQTLSGTPALVSDDGTWFLDFDWGNGGPGVACGVGADHFSVRWTRDVNLTAGLYRFTVTADDGVRLFIDNQLRLDKWQDQAPSTYTVDVSLTEGQHNLRLEYYENSVGAVARLSWQQISSCSTSVPADQWKGEYFSNRGLSGSPSMIRNDGTGYLNFDWGTGSPSSGCGIGSDNYSVRWTRNVYFSNTAMYRFTVTADDGVRLYVDGQLKIDRWYDQGPTTYTVDTQLNAGTHNVVLAYYENGGGAVAKLSWQAIASVFVQPIVWEFNTTGVYDGWSVWNASASSVNSGILFIDPSGVDPYVTGPNISAQASVYKYVQVRFANNGLDDTAAVYFRTQAENYYSEDKKVVFRAANCALCGNAPFYGYTILMSGNMKWTGTITGLRFDPTGSGQGGTNRDSIGIDYIRLTQTQ